MTTRFLSPLRSLSLSKGRSWLANAPRLLPRRDDYAELGRSWRADLLAGVTVGIVALPLALAFGVASGVGPAVGLVTAVVAGFVAAVFGGSSVQVSGPTGAMAVVLAPIVAVHGAGAVGLVALLGGALVLIAGVLGLGKVVGFIPWPVIEGFTLGIGMIIFLQQIPTAVGLSASPGERTAVAAFQALVNADWSVAAWSIGAVLAVAVIMFALPKLHRAIPASLIAVAVVTVAAELAGLPLIRISDLFGTLPSSLPAPALPQIDPAALQSLGGAALAVAALAAIESLLSARVAASMVEHGEYEPDRELVGQGLASIAAGFFGGMPATGAIARTAVNVRSGARTRVAAIVHALVLLIVVYLASNWISRIPMAALAGVLMITAIRMLPIASTKIIFRSTRADALIFTITAIVTVAFDLIEAVQVGIVVAAFFALRSIARYSVARRQSLPGDEHPGDDQIALFRLDGALFFGAADRVLREIGGVEGAHVVILRLSHVDVLDVTGARALVEIVTELERRKITVLIKGVQPRHLRLVTNVGVLKSLRHHEHLFDDLDSAVAHARGHITRSPFQRAGATSL